MPKIFNDKNIKYKKKDGPINKYNWSTSLDLAQLAN